MDKQNTLGQPPTAVFLGVGRNVSRYIGRVLENFSAIETRLKIIEWFLVTSDCSDDTLPKLDKLKRSYQNLGYVDLGNLRNRIPDRVQRISYCRQMALQRVAESDNKPDFVIVADLDNVNSHVSFDSLGEWLSREDWSAVFPSTIGPYYDIFALRDPKFISDSYPELVSQAAQRGESRLFAYFNHVVRLQKHLANCEEDFSVESAFGGFGIYRTDRFLKSSYISKSNNACEHVTLNLQITGKKFVSSGLRVKSPIRHVLLAMQPAYGLLYFLFAAKKIAKRLFRSV